MFSIFRQDNNSSNSKENNIRKFACFNCRFDKKKCDKKLPVCFRCSELKLDCKSYEGSDRHLKLLPGNNKPTIIKNKRLVRRNKGIYF